MATIAEELDAVEINDELERNEEPIGFPWLVLKTEASPGVAKIGKVQEGPFGYASVSPFGSASNGAYFGAFANVLEEAGQFAYALGEINKVAILAERTASLWCLRVNPGGGKSGYQLFMEKKAGNAIRYVLTQWLTGTPTTLAETETESYGVGSRIAIVVGEETVYMFAAKKGKGFEEVMKGADATYTEGYSGLETRGLGEFVTKDFATGVFAAEAGEPEPEAGKVKILVGGVIKEVNRWVLVGDKLVAK